MDIDERAGIFIFAVGLVSFVIGILFLEILGSVTSACGIFFGITFIALGLLIRLGFFYGNILSLNGLGSMFVLLSVIFFALSVSLMQFMKLEIINVVPIIFRGTVIGARLAVEYERIYLPLCIVLLRLCLFFLVTGLFIKIYSAIRPKSQN